MVFLQEVEAFRKCRNFHLSAPTLLGDAPLRLAFNFCSTRPAQRLQVGLFAYKKKDFFFYQSWKFQAPFRCAAQSLSNVKPNPLQTLQKLSDRHICKTKRYPEAQGWRYKPFPLSRNQIFHQQASLPRCHILLPEPFFTLHWTICNCTY